ncbi:regulatory protein GemA [Neorhizobium petrolearium]|uniref:regulatory protein GemA n=1 Tax=Neorhizobium petrolearium TaxID=515361 RepID=UPI003F80D8E1
MTSTIAAIQTGIRQLGIVDDKRSLYVRITGKDTLTAMTVADKDAVLAELRRLGFKPSSKRSTGRRKLSGRYAGKLQALWIAAYNLGLVRDRDDSALEAFVRRQTGLSSERFLRFPDDARAVIEALKDWISREAGVEWNRAPLDWLSVDGARISWAQWKILHPGASLVVRQGFDQVALAAAGRTDWLGAMTPQDWIRVMNELGKRIRAARKAVAA